ncbi:15616_t:CDS:2, partial [Gigaspora rosea]
MNLCEVVPSTHGKDKINVYGYLMTKDKSRKNAFYWSCEKKKLFQCCGRAVTKLVNNEHYLQSWIDHNHVADASRSYVAITIAKIKEKAQQSNNRPSRIAQDAIADSPHFVYQYLPSSNAIRQTIQRIWHLDLPTELLSLESLVIPQNMRTTLSGHDFLINDTNIGQDRILIFTTVDNVRYLSRSPFWTMDGTFKMDLLCLDNYIQYMTEELYRRVLQGLVDFAEENNINLLPQMVLTDFESAAINAIQLEFEDIQCKGCHFHLAQSVYRRIQTTGLTVRYGTNEEFSLLIRHILALAFLPYSEILQAFDELKTNLLPKANNISVVDNIELAFSRTQNCVEAWHRRWDMLVGCAHAGVFKIIREIQKEQNQIQLNIEAIMQSAPRPPQRRYTIERKQHIQT